MQVRKNDKADKDWRYQQAAYKGYKHMCRQDKSWMLVKCVEKSKLLTKGQISDRIMQILQDEKFV